MTGIQLPALELLVVQIIYDGHFESFLIKLEIEACELPQDLGGRYW